MLIFDLMEAATFAQLVMLIITDGSCQFCMEVVSFAQPVMLIFADGSCQFVIQLGILK